MAYQEHATSTQHERMAFGYMRLALVVIFVAFGTVKYTDPGWMGIMPFIANSPFISWLNAFGAEGAGNIIGAFEVLFGALLAFGFWRPESRLAIAGAVGAVVTFLTTLSFMITTPGVFGTNGMPLFGPPLSEFLIKDSVLLGASLVLLAQGLAQRRGLRSERAPAIDARPVGA